ncbi:MAG: hypothetical protein EA381_10920 [Planctomycetaceae bacterium]|nr:MAG: hypothetical protein EA381_10920 [Planctomycetaceae bacterium]
MRPTEWPVATQASAALLAAGLLCWLGWFSAHALAPADDARHPELPNASTAQTPGGGDAETIATSIPSTPETNVANEPNSSPQPTHSVAAVAAPEAAAGTAAGSSERPRSVELSVPREAFDSGQLATADRSEGSLVASDSTNSAERALAKTDDTRTAAGFEKGSGPSANWLSPVSARQGGDEDEVGQYRLSTTPNPPQFDPAKFSDGAEAGPRLPSPAISSTPYGIADWSQYLTPNEGTLLPASADLPSPGTDPAAESTSGRALFVDPSPQVSESPTGDFYR